MVAPAVLPVDVDPAAADPELPDVVPDEPVLVVAVEALVVDDAAEELLEPVNALTSAWKSCCSFASVASIGSGVDPVDVPDEEVAEDAEEVAGDVAEELDEEDEEVDEDDEADEELARSCSRF